MTRRHVLAGFLLLAILPTATLAAQAQSHSREIETVELQFLSTKNSDQRKELVRQLKQLTAPGKISGSTVAEDAKALNVAVSAMLPMADSAEEAEELLRIGSANPAGRSSGSQTGDRVGPQDSKFLVNARESATAARR